MAPVTLHVTVMFLGMSGFPLCTQESNNNIMVVWFEIHPYMFNRCNLQMNAK